MPPNLKGKEVLASVTRLSTKFIIVLKLDGRFYYRLDIGKLYLLQKRTREDSSQAQMLQLVLTMSWMTESVLISASQS
eukprot:10141307-Ditylum_brightwellii.AAC.1